ncbi:MAG: hypothetical protein IV085_09615, partial [Thiobacillus sp.]|nr:hypothetical protein [Thiobacillus sp.]
MLTPHVPESRGYPSHPILLPAVLQADGDAPCFGTISGLSDQGLVFNFQGSPLTQANVGRIARLDFDLMGLHHSCKVLIVHIQDKRALLSLRETATNVRAALQSINQDSLPTLASRLSTQQAQQACHTHFMQVMQRVVEGFYHALPAAVESRLAASPDAPGALALLGAAMESLRPKLVRHFTVAYPMYPEQLDIPLHATTDHQTGPADMARVDEWIRRTTIAQQVVKHLDALPETFNRHYSGLLNNPHKRTPHPYHPDAVLQLLSELIEPLRLDAESRGLCYEVMGRAFADQACALYEDMLRIVRQAPASAHTDVHHNLSLEQWLKLAADKPDAGQAVDGRPLGALTALLERLLANLDAAGPPDASTHAGAYPLTRVATIPGLLARDRIFGRFLPPDAGLDTTGTAVQGELALLETEPTTPPAGATLGGLSDLDQAAM